jgi:hypothetical protein
LKDFPVPWANGPPGNEIDLEGKPLFELIGQIDKS